MAFIQGKEETDRKISPNYLLARKDTLVGWGAMEPFTGGFWIWAFAVGR